MKVFADFLKKRCSKASSQVKRCSTEHEFPVLSDLSAGQFGHAELQISPEKQRVLCYLRLRDSVGN